MQLHEILRKLRRDTDFTQQNVADEIGMDITTYNRYEKDASTMQYETLVKLASLYKMSVSELMLYGEDELSMVKEPTMMEFPDRRSVMVSIELDGEKSTLDFWISKLKKINTAMA